MIGKIEFGPASASSFESRHKEIVIAALRAKVQELETIAFQSQNAAIDLSKQLITRDHELEVMSGELEACRKDAERYRWLMSTAKMPDGNIKIDISDETPERLEAFIDARLAAMAQEGGE